MFKRCEHKYHEVARIGKNAQAIAVKCEKCSKRKVVSFGWDKISYLEVLEYWIDKQRGAE